MKSEPPLRFRASGTSMLPSIFPGCVLHVHPVDANTVKVGDIVGYPATDHVIAAHRVVAINKKTANTGLEVKGDAHSETESIDPKAVAFKIDRVSFHIWSYDVDQPFGQLLARLSLKNGLAWRAALHFSSLGVRIIRRVKRRNC